MRKYLIGLVTGAVIFAGGVAVASIPDGSGVIHSCYKNSTGSLKVIDSASQSCASGETALTWNQTGPQGPAGANGASGYVRVADGHIPGCMAGCEDTTDLKQADVTCPGSKVVVGGGWSTSGSVYATGLKSFPPSTNQWTVTAQTTVPGGSWALEVYALCVSP